MAMMGQPSRGIVAFAHSIATRPTVNRKATITDIILQI